MLYDHTVRIEEQERNAHNIIAALMAIFMILAAIGYAVVMVTYFKGFVNSPPWFTAFMFMPPVALATGAVVILTYEIK